MAYSNREDYTIASNELVNVLCNMKCTRKGCKGEGKAINFTRPFEINFDLEHFNIGDISISPDVCCSDFADRLEKKYWEIRTKYPEIKPSPAL